MILTTAKTISGTREACREFWYSKHLKLIIESFVVHIFARTATPLHWCSTQTHIFIDFAVPKNEQWNVKTVSNALKLSDVWIEWFENMTQTDWQYDWPQNRKLNSVVFCLLTFSAYKTGVHSLNWFGEHFCAQKEPKIFQRIYCFNSITNSVVLFDINITLGLGLCLSANAFNIELTEFVTIYIYFI